MLKCMQFAGRLNQIMDQRNRPRKKRFSGSDALDNRAMILSRSLGREGREYDDLVPDLFRRHAFRDEKDVIDGRV
jgi:hypothetical protein